MTGIFQSITDTAKAAGREFILIGGHAVNARGYERTTLDFDFLIPSADLGEWKEMLAALGYRAIHQVAAFAQFDPVEGEGFRVDLMLVDDGTFAKLVAGSEIRPYGGREIRVAGVLHLIALKLHAARTWDRAVLGKDYYDILNLIRINQVDTSAPDFRKLLERYATPSIKQRLLSDLQRDI